MSSEGFCFALISDSHLTEPGTALPLRSAIEMLNRERPDFVLFGGDMMDMGTEAQYAIFLEALGQLRVPYRTLPGNHDLGNAGQAARYLATFGALNTHWEIAGHHCLALDTTNTDPNPDNWHGRVEAAAMSWIREALDDIPVEAPLVLFTHHGLVGRPEDLSRDVENAEEVLALLGGRRLRAGFCGHTHRLLLNRWRGIPFVSAPPLSVSRESIGVPPGFLWVDVGADGLRVRLEIAL